MADKQAMPAVYVIARNTVTKQSRNMGSVSEIAPVAEFILSEAEGLPRNDGRKKSRNRLRNTPNKSNRLCHGYSRRMPAIAKLHLNRYNSEMSRGEYSS
jgi:hypothetical protein